MSGYALYTPDVLTAAGLIVAELERINLTLSHWEKKMSAQADALTAEVVEVKRVIGEFVTKFQDALAQLQAAQGDEAAMAAATADLAALLDPIKAIVEPPPA